MNSPLKSFRGTHLVIALVAAMLCGVPLRSAFAQEAKLTAEQEAKLTATLTNAFLNGRWAPIKDGHLGPEKEDAYEIVSVQKMDGGKWQINARVQYQGQAITLPVPVTVNWTGDTMVLIFDGVSLGTPRMYSARLMIHDNTYSGTWSGGDHGGMLYGLISHGAN